MTRRVLLIPHHPPVSGVRIRMIELARALAGRYDVSLLTWRAAADPGALRDRVRASMADLTALLTDMRDAQGLRWIAGPTLHRPAALAHLFNRTLLRRALRLSGADVVVNGSYYLFSADRGRHHRYVIDIADLPGRGVVDRGTAREVLRADAVVAVSEPLAAFAAHRYGRPAVCIPNGFRRDAMCRSESGRVRAIRAALGPPDAVLVGYIGAIGPWIDVPLMTAAFRAFRAAVPAARLVWVGPARDLAARRALHGEEGVTFIGPVDRDIEDWFMAMDIGVLPSVRTPFQDMAFHLKVIEFTAAGKPVVATDLAATRALGFPNVHLVSAPAPEAWLAALTAAHAGPRDPAWSALAAPYDWDAIAGRYAAVIEGLP